MEGKSGLGHRLPERLADFSISLPIMESVYDDEQFEVSCKRRAFILTNYSRDRISVPKLL